jgi:hypothetical protein
MVAVTRQRTLRNTRCHATTVDSLFGPEKESTWAPWVKGLSPSA